MKVSVIIPVHNRESLVRDAIASALAQTQPPFEIIVVDDGSTDRTGEAVKSFGDRVILLSQTQSGPAAARNTGAARANGDWLAFLDSDDLWLPGKLATQTAHLAAHPEIDLLHSDGFVVLGETVPQNLDPSATFYKNRTPAQGDDALPLFLRAPIITPAVMIRRSVFADLGGFDPALRYMEDVDLWIRFMASGRKTGFVKEPLVIIRDLSRGRGLPRVAASAASVAALENNFYRFPHIRQTLRPHLYNSAWITFLYSLRDNDPANARLHLRKCLRYGRPGIRAYLFLLFLHLGGSPGFKLTRRFYSGAIERLN